MCGALEEVVVIHLLPFQQAAEPGWSAACERAAVLAGLASLPASQGNSPPLDEQVSRQLPFMRTDFRKALNPSLV